MPMFESYADSGNIQFSDEAVTYCFIEKGQVDLNHLVVDTGGILGPAVYSYVGCTTSILGAGLVTGITDYIVAISTTTDTILGQVPGTSSIFSKDPCTVDYWVFASMKEVAAPPPANGVGLQLFDAAGDLIYDSRFVPLRIVDIQTNINIANGASTSVTGLPSGKTYAWFMTGSQRRPSAAYASPTIVKNPPSPTPYAYPWNYPTTYPGVRKVSATSFNMQPVTLGYMQMGSVVVFPPSSVDGSAFAGAILTADVSGLTNEERKMTPSPASWFNLNATNGSSQTITLTPSKGSLQNTSWNFELQAGSGTLTLSGATNTQVTATISGLSTSSGLIGNIRCYSEVDGIKRTILIPVNLYRP